MDYILIIMLVAILVVLTIIHKIGKNKRPLSRAFVSMFLGLVFLLMVNITSFFTGVKIPISLFTVGVSAGGGIPGIAFLLFLNLL